MKVDTRTEGKVIDLLRSGKIDIYLTSTPLKDSNFEYVEVFQDEMVLLTHDHHELAGNKDLKIDDLHRETFISHYTPTDKHLLFDRIINPEIENPYIIQINTTQQFLEYINAGLGIGVASYWVIEPYLKYYRDITLNKFNQPMNRYWYMVYPSTKRDIEPLVDFVKMFKASVSKKKETEKIFS